MQRIDLDETAINESLTASDRRRRASFATTWFQYDIQHWTTDEGPSAGPVNGAIDWDSNGWVVEGVTIPMDVTDDGAQTFLRGFDDWSNLVFTGGRVGGGVQLPPPQVTEIEQELTLVEAQSLGLAPPTKLHGTVADGQKIVLTWKPVGPKKEASYKVYRGVNGGAPVEIGTAENSNFEDAAIVAGTTYTYRVTVVNALSVESAQAATVHVEFSE